MTTTMFKGHDGKLRSAQDHRDHLVALSNIHGNPSAAEYDEDFARKLRAELRELEAAHFGQG